MKQVLLIVSIFIVSHPSLQAQQTCEVKLKDIQGTYTGECLKEKANGKGKSIGEDQYEGEFKDGYPEGNGIYTWKDGHYYVGNFVKGKKDGKGDMYYESASGQDSVVSGYWKKDKYLGQYEKQFIVINSTSRINKVDCSLTDKKGSDIFITVHQKSSGGNFVAVVSSISNIAGTFYTKSQQSMSNSSLTRLQQVEFPFRAIFYLSSGENTEILFNEKGNYDVYIDLQ